MGHTYVARAEARVELSAQSCGHLPLGVHSPDPKDIQPVRGSVSVLLCLGPSPSAPESASMEPGSGQCMLCGSHSGAWATEVLALLFPQPEVSLPKPLGLRVEAQRSGLPAAAATATAAEYQRGYFCHQAYASSCQMNYFKNKTEATVLSSYPGRLNPHPDSAERCLLYFSP